MNFINPLSEKPLHIILKFLKNIVPQLTNPIKLNILENSRLLSILNIFELIKHKLPINIISLNILTT